MKKLLAASLLVLGLAACTNADFHRTFNYGAGGRVTCYSGGVVISDDFSAGRIHTEQGSDGWYYVSSSDNDLKQVSGQCVVQQRVTPPANFVPVYPK